MNENPARGSGSSDAGDPPARKKSTIRRTLGLLLVLGLVVPLIVLLPPAVRNAREAGRRITCAGKLDGVSIALASYVVANGALPPAYTTDADGKPLHSWRTLILPFMGREQLYKSIDLTKPWDDPVNAEACKTMVSDYRCPSSGVPDNCTTYLAIVTLESCFRATEPRNLSDITDGTARTLLLIEVDAAHAVPWMAPIDADEELVLGIGPKFSPIHSGLFQAGFVDGHAEFFDADMPADQRRALISIAGNDDAAVDGAK